MQSSTSNSSRCAIASYLLIAGIPLAAAGQNILLALACLLLLLILKLDPPELTAEADLRLQTQTRHLSLLICLVLLSVCLATALNPLQTRKDHLLNFLMGYADVAFVPLIAIGLRPYFTKMEKEKILHFFCYVIMILSLMCVSQAFFGWRRDGLEIIWQKNFRAQGMFSHPLTLAYMGLILWPSSVRYWLKNPKNLFAVVLVLSTAIILWTSLSRIVQLIALVIFIINVWQVGAKKLKPYILAAVVIGLAAVIWIPNPVAKNFVDTWEGKADRHARQYQDDRVAFWHAHVLLLAEKPLLGHGNPIPKSKIVQSYKRIGLANFIKQYNAHNSFLQLACEGGLAALAIFLVWFALWGRLLAADAVLLQTWLAFGLASLTQNAFQDSEVRYTLSLFLAYAALTLKPKKSKAKAKAV